MLKDKDLTQSYEELSYPNDAYSVCDPASLIANARLHALRLGANIPPSIWCQDDKANLRILEIGCAQGGNIIPLAAKYPNMRCVGVDLSPSQIAHARQDASALQLDNIELYAASILDIAFDEGSFDIVIAHGVLSWVDRETARAIVARSGQLLKESGLLYVSYNTLPGWYQEKAIRDMMEFHARNAGSASDEIAKAREILKVGGELARDERYQANLREEQAVLQQVPNGYLYHDYLETFNEPYYLKDVVALAQGGALSYLGDCDMTSYQRSPQMLAFIEKNALDTSLAQYIVHEQYQDFFCNRRFRQSIFIKAELSDTSSAEIERVDLASFAFLLHAQPEQELSRYELSQAKSLFLIPQSNEDRQIVKQIQDEGALRIMRWLLMHKRRAVDYAELQSQLAPISGDALNRVLHTLLLDGLITLTQPLLTQQVPANPYAWYVSRYYASIAASSVNLYHKNISLDRAARCLLILCDGSRDRVELVNCIYNEVRAAAQQAKQPQDDYPYVLLGERMVGYSQQDCKQLVQFFVDDALIQFSKLGLLIE